MSAPKPELTTHERAEKMVAERLGFAIIRHGDEWLYMPKNARRRLLASVPEMKLWSEAVRLQEELLKRGETCKK